MSTTKEKRSSGPRGPMHGHGAMLPGEKPKDLKGTLRKLLRYMSEFKVSLIIVFVFAIASTVFVIVGPKILSTATTELFNGISAKISHTGGINFDKVAEILIITMGLYIISALCSFIQGWMMSYVSQQTAYRMRQDYRS